MLRPCLQKLKKEKKHQGAPYEAHRRVPDVPLPNAVSAASDKTAATDRNHKNTIPRRRYVLFVKMAIWFCLLCKVQLAGSNP